MSRSSSAVVDSKVVEMSLDNKNFEQNATISIATLKKLQEALDFSNSTDGLDKVNSSVKKVKFDSLLSGIEQAKSGFSALEAVAFGAFANIGKKIEDYAEKVAFAIPKQIVEGGKSRAFNMEQAKFMIDGLAEQTGATFKDVEKSIRDAVSDTAYGFDEAAKAASQLLASSVQVGDQMDHALLAISGVSAMTGSSYSEIAHIFTTIAGNGKVMTEQLNQFSVRGLNAAAALANQLGVTEDEVRTMVHKGKIDFQTFADAMDDAFGKHAKDANKTFAGSFANIKAVFSRMGQSFIGPGMESITKVFNHLLPLLKEVEARVGKLAEKIMPKFDTLADGVSTAIDTIYTAITGKDPVKQAGEEAEDAAGKTLSNIEKIRKGALEVIRGDYGNGKEIRFPALEAAGYDDPQAVQDYVNKLWELNGQTWELTDAVLAQTDAYFGNYDALDKLSDDDLKAAGMSDEDIKTLRESAEAAKELAKNTELTADEMANMDNKTKFIVGLQKTFGGLSTIFGKIGEVISNKFAGFSLQDFKPIDFLSTKFLELSQTFNTFATEHADDIAGIFNGIMSAAGGLWDILRLAGGVVWNVLGGIFGAFGTSVLEVAGWIGNAVGAVRDWFTENEILKKSLDWIRTTVENVTGKVRDFFNGFIKLPGFQAGLTKIKTAFSNAFEKLPKHFEGTKKAFADFKERVKEMGGFKLSNVVTIFKDFKDNVIGQFLDFEPFRKIKEGVVDMVTTVRTKLEEMSYDAEGNETTFGKVYHTLGAGFDWIADKVSKAKEKIKNWWEEYDIGSFLEKQFNRFSIGLGYLWRSSIDFFKGLPGVIGDFWNQVMESGGFSFDNLGNIFQIFKDTIGKYFADFDGFDGLKYAFGSLWTDLKAKLKEMGFDIDKWKEKILGWKDNIVAAITGIPDAIANFSLPDAFQTFIDFLTGKDSKNAEKGAEGVTKSVESMNKTITSSMDKRFMGAAMPVISFFSEDVAKEIQDNADSMDDTTKGFFGKTLGQYLPGIAAVLDKVFASFGDIFVKAFEGIKNAFGDLEPGWITRVGKALLSLAGLVILGKVAWAVSSFVSAWGAEKKANAKNINANAWLKKAAAIAIVAGVIYGLAQMELGDLIKGGAAVALIAIVLGGIDIALAKIKGKDKNAKSAGDSLLKIAGAIAIIAVLAVVMSFIPWDVLISGLKKVLTIAAVLVGVTLALKLLSKISDADVGKGLKDLAIAISILAAIAVILSFISWDRFGNGMIKLGIIMGSILIFLALLALIKKKLGTPMAAVKGLAVLIGVMTASLLVLSFLSWEQIGKGLLALLGVAGILIGTLAAIAAINKLLGPATTSIKGLALLFAIMAGALVVLTLVDPEKLKLAMGAMALMGGLAAVLTVVASKFDIKTSNLIKMLVIMGVLAAIVTAVAAITDYFDIEANLETFTALSEMMIAIAACMILVAIASKVAAGASAGIGALLPVLGIVLLIVAAVGLIAYALGGLDDMTGGGVSSSIEKGLEILNTILTGIATTIVNFFTSGIQAALDALPAMADAIVEFMDHLSKINDVPFPDLGKCGAAVLAFLGMEVMGAISGALNWLLGDNMTEGMARLPGMADSLVDFMSHLGALNDVTVPGLGRFGIAILAFVGTEIMGAISGALNMIMGDNMSEGMGRLPGMADSLVSFMTHLSGLNSIKVPSLWKFASVLGLFVGTEVMGAISAVTEMLIGDDMSAGMAKLPGMARRMVTFYTELTALNDLPYVSFGRFTSLIAAVIACDFTGLFTAIGDEIVQGISDEGEDGMMATFTRDLEALSGAITEWVGIMDGLKGTTLDMTPINDAITAVTAANEEGLVSSLSDALKKFFTDDQKTTMENFSEDILTFGKAISEFENQFGDVKVKIDKDGIHDLINALEEVKGVEGGGLIGAITDFFGGDVTSQLEDFKTHAPELGAAIMEFNNSIGEDIDPEKLTAASQAAKNIGEFAASVSGYVMGTDFNALSDYLSQNLGPALNDFVASIENLGDLSTLGDSLSNISTSMSVLTTMTISEGDIVDSTVVEQFRGNVESLSAMIGDLTSLDTSGVDKFSNAIGSINGLDLDAAGKNINKKKAGDNAQESVDAAKNVFANDTSVAAAAGGMISGALSAISGQSASFQNEGKNLVIQLAAGIIMGKGSVSSAGKGAADAATSAMKDAKSSAKSLGGDFARGYGSGITENTSFVASAVRALVERAKRTAREAQNSASPSKDTYKYGRWFVQGYANAIRDYRDQPAAAAEVMIKGTLSTMDEALMAASDLLEGTDEYQPTITPILDLTNVENGAAGLSSLLDTSPVIGANLGAITANNTAMKQRTSMTDLLEAMEDLGNVIGSDRTVNNYNVNGVTYDDGTNVSSAVGDLIRAVNIERRA